MKRTTFLLFLCISLITTGFSQTKKESIKELFVLMKQDSTMQKMFESMPAMISAQTPQLKDSSGIAKSKEMMKKSMEIVKTMFPKIQEDMIEYYDKYFTQDEINDFISFYKSASGQKMLNTTPLIMKEMMLSFQGKYMKEIIVEFAKTMVKTDNVNIRKPSLKPDSTSIAQMKAEYLDIETSNLQNTTDEQKQILRKAKDRTERYVTLENNQYVLNASKASDLNMSERLFELIKSTIKQSNMLIDTLKKQ